jgi:hypothetical protein
MINVVFSCQLDPMTASLTFPMEQSLAAAFVPRGRIIMILPD